MLLLPLAVAIGSITGALTGGRSSRLSELKFRHPWVVLAAIVLQVTLGLPAIRNWPPSMRFAILIITYLLIGAWLLENVQAFSGYVRSGLALVGVGWLSNLVAILLNRGMPVSEAALRKAGIAMSTSITRGHLSKHVLANHGTALWFLGDVLPLPWLRTVMSAGDVVMAIGIGVVVAGSMERSASTSALVEETSALVEEAVTVEDAARPQTSW